MRYFDDTLVNELIKIVLFVLGIDLNSERERIPFGMEAQYLNSETDFQPTLRSDDSSLDREYNCQMENDGPAVHRPQREKKLPGKLKDMVLYNIYN